MKRRWLQLLGDPSFALDGYDRKSRLIAAMDTPYGRAEWWQQPTGPGQAQKVILIRPENCGEGVPGAIVPFYHPETVAGLLLDEERQTISLDPDRSEKSEVRCMGRHLARQGYAVACIEAFPFNTVPKPEVVEGFAWWQLAAEKLRRDHPGWTGLGKLIHDTSRGLDLLLEEMPVDRRRIVAMGHSLGGKRVFYTGALDERIQAVIGSDFGIPWQSTNWQDLWYLGDRVPADDAGMAHHELLALLAPRPFFLIAGQTDTAESWRYLEAARPIYELYGKGKGALLGGVNHASGHSPTYESLDKAYQWLREQFNLPRLEWREK